MDCWSVSANQALLQKNFLGAKIKCCCEGLYLEIGNGNPKKLGVAEMNENGQAGFTLIELVVVIVILGILAATALPKFIDLSDNAHLAALQGTAGGLQSADAINYAGCSAMGNVVTTGKCVKMTKCSDVGTLLNPSLTIGTTCSTSALYLTADTAASTTNGTSVTCTLNYGKGSTCASGGSATFTVTGAGN